jgi:hypothetical protein
MECVGRIRGPDRLRHKPGGGANEGARVPHPAPIKPRNEIRTARRTLRKPDADWRVHDWTGMFRDRIPASPIPRPGAQTLKLILQCKHPETSGS